MAYWSSRGLRGSALEELVNLTNERYREKGLCLIQKIPTPIKPVQLDPENGNIKLAFFEQRSTVDYIGVVQGIPVCFDAKEISKELFPLKNIHEHQMVFMEDFQKQEGIAFLIISFTKTNENYLVPYDQLKIWWDNAKNGQRQSIPYSAFKEFYKIPSSDGYLIHYLVALQAYLEVKE